MKDINELDTPTMHIMEEEQVTCMAPDPINQYIFSSIPGHIEQARIAARFNRRQAKIAYTRMIIMLTEFGKDSKPFEDAYAEWQALKS